MNNTAYKPLKKLLLMSLVLVGGHLMGQSSNQDQLTQPVPANPQLLSTKAPQSTTVEAKPAKNAAYTTTNVAPASSSSKAVSTQPTGKLAERKALAANRKTTAAPVAASTKTPSSRVGGSKEPVSGAPSVQSQIDDINAKLAKHPDMPEAQRKSLESRLDALKKGQGTIQQKK